MNRAFSKIAIIILFFIVLSLRHSDTRALYAQNQKTNDIEQLDFANGLFERGLYEMALVEYKKFIEEFSDSSYVKDAHFGMAESLFFIESYKEAIEAYQKYAKSFASNEKEAISRLRLGQAFFLTKQYGRALSTLKRVKIQDLNDQFIQSHNFYTGRNLFELGENKKAINYFLLSAKSPEQKYKAHSFLFLGDIYLENKEYDKAIEHYTKSYEHAVTDQMKGMSLYKQGDTHFKAGKYEPAIEKFKVIVKDYPLQDISNDALVNLFNSYYNLGQYTALIDNFKEYKAQNKLPSEIFDVYFISVFACLHIQQYENALNILNDILNFKSLDDDKRNKVLLKKAEILIQSEQFQNGINIIETSLNNSTNDIDQILFLKAEGYYGLENFEKAFDSYQKIITDFPQSPLTRDALYAMAHAKKSYGKPKEALPFFLQYFDAVDNGSKKFMALYNAMLIEVHFGLIDEAIKHGNIYLSAFKEGQQQYPPKNIDDPLFIAAEKILYLMGTLYQNKGQYHDAIKILKEYIVKHPNSERLQEIYFLLGFNQQQTGNLEDALKSYLVLKFDEGKNNFYYSALKNISFIYLSQKEEDKAIEALNSIITKFEKNDLDIATYLWLAEKYLSKGQNQDVLRILNNPKIQSDNPEEISGAAYFKAEALRRTNNYENAIKEYEEVLSTKKRNTYWGAARVGKGLCLIETKDFDQARKELNAAIEENPEEHTITMQARFALATIEHLAENFEAAIKYYMLVAVLYKDRQYCPMALYQAGGLLEEVGKPIQALKAYQEVVRNYQQSPLVPKAIERISQLSAR